MTTDTDAETDEPMQPWRELDWDDIAEAFLGTILANIVLLAVSFFIVRRLLDMQEPDRT